MAHHVLATDAHTLLVAAPAGRTFPWERSRSQIGQDPRRVPNTAYYRRALADGDLLPIDPVVTE